ncbi:MAG TPA: GntR family transcriptional regulator [Thermomicrobiales bacterium]
MNLEGDQTNNHAQAEVAYRAIRRAILQCDLGPGEQVSEVQLAGSYGFGRAAVRAALTRLSHDGLVQAIPRRGYAIAPITFKNVQDLFGVRLIVEPATARLAATRADNAVVADLERLNEASAHVPGREDLAALREANKAFHVAVARISGNDRLAEIANRVLDELDRVLYLKQVGVVWDRVDATFTEHQRIIDALKIRDPRAAEQAAYDHIVPNQRGVIDALIASPGLRSINLVTV